MSVPQSYEHFVSWKITSQIFMHLIQTLTSQCSFNIVFLPRFCLAPGQPTSLFFISWSACFGCCPLNSLPLPPSQGSCGLLSSTPSQSQL